MRQFSGACVKRPDLSSGPSFFMGTLCIGRNSAEQNEIALILSNPARPIARVDVKISVIVPAYNEEKLIGRCIRSIHSALAANVRPGLETEIIVANNNSGDSTEEVAKKEGARVVFEPINQISRARNAGAAAATGDWLLFIDADSELNADSFRDLLAKIDSGMCAGGGS